MISGDRGFKALTSMVDGSGCSAMKGFWTAGAGADFFKADLGFCSGISSSDSDWSCWGFRVGEAGGESSWGYSPFEAMIAVVARLDSEWWWRGAQRRARAKLAMSLCGLSL